MEESIQIPCYKVKDWSDKPKSEEVKDIQRGEVVELADSSRLVPMQVQKAVGKKEMEACGKQKAIKQK